MELIEIRLLGTVDHSIFLFLIFRDLRSINEMGRPSDAVVASAYGIDAEAASPVSSPNVSQEKLYGKPIKSWKGYIWDTWDLPKDQRWLMFKLDAFILTFASVSLPLPFSLFLPLLIYNANVVLLLCSSATSSKTSTKQTSTTLS
jgi:hypothetical protein